MSPVKLQVNKLNLKLANEIKFYDAYLLIEVDGCLGGKGGWEVVR
jgi:hypothetical protein